MKKVLVFGFEKYDRLNVNPSEIIVKSVSRDLDNLEFVVLPTNFGDGGSWDILREVIERGDFDFVIGFGMSGKPRVAVENFAVNMVDSTSPDNNGEVVRNKKIREDDLLAYEAGIDSLELVQFFKSKKIPSIVSYFADTYVCNFVYYNLLSYISRKGLKSKAVFVHVPASPEIVNELDVAMPSFPLDLIVEAVEEYIREL